MSASQPPLSFASDQSSPSSDWVYRTAHDSATVGFDGDYGRVPLRPGLQVHYCEGRDRHHRTSLAELKPGLALYVFLCGRPDAQLGGQPLVSKDWQQRGGPHAVLVSRARPELLERHGHPGNYTRKLAISMSGQWLEDCGLPLHGGHLDLASFAERHLSQVEWKPQRTILSAAEGVLQVSGDRLPFQQLYLESRVLELIASTFHSLVDPPARSQAARLRAGDQQRLDRLRDYIDHAPPSELSLSGLAACAGVSVSTVQRLFQAALGVSPVDYIRQRTLERVRDALRSEHISVKEAAFRAGYRSAANFSTAFRKHFGYAPSQAPD